MRIALFGGTFDPIHNAHVALAREAASRFELDRVLVIPAAHPPHKRYEGRAPFEDRFRMVELACAGLPPLEASRLEEGAEKSYSIHTIERIGLQIGDRLFYLIGADAFAEIETWHRWRDVIAKTEFIVASRPGHAYNVPEGARAYRLDTLNLDVSSTAIREQFLRGVRPDGLADPVWNYIVSHKLYTHP